MILYKYIPYNSLYIYIYICIYIIVNYPLYLHDIPMFGETPDEIAAMSQATIPVTHPKRSAKQQLARLPSKAPLLVPTEALPWLGAAKNLPGFTVD